MNNIGEILTKNFILICEKNNLINYQLGYRESMLTLIYGENYVEEKLNIDVDRFSPGSALRISYNNGWNEKLKSI